MPFDISMDNDKTNQRSNEFIETINLAASHQFEAREQDIQRGAMTISQLLAEKGLKGGITLTPGFDTTAYGFLSSNRGVKYKVGDIIAKGGMGTILDAKDLNCRRKVAMKVLSEEFQDSPDQIYRFILEGQVCAQLEHPGIVPVYELSIDANSSVFYTMKLVRGVTLVDVLIEIKENNHEYIEKYPLIRLLNIFLRVCDAIAFAHSKNVVHRDLKPENIMLGDFGEVLVMDWGLAKILKNDKTPGKPHSGETAQDNGASTDFDDTIDSILSDGGGNDSMKTMYGQVMGTPGFMPPEQALGKVEDIDIRSDVYALGGILYNILALQPSITGLSIKQLIRQIVRGDIQPPSSLNIESRFPHCPGEKIPEPLSAIAMKALSSHPSDRYQHVEEIQADVEKYLGGFATSVEDAGFFKLLLLLIKRNKTKFITAAAVLIVLVSLITGFMIKIIEAKEIAEENLHKFLHEHNTRKEISRKLLTTAIIAIKENNPNQKVLYHRYSLLDEDFSLSMAGNSQLVNVSPLEELPLTQLDLSNTKISDLHYLTGMPLRWLNISNTSVKDITPLAGLPLVYLDISGTSVDNLTSLAGIGIKTLNISNTRIGSVSSLAGLPITSLTIDGSQISSPEIVTNLNLEHLTVINCTANILKLIKDSNIPSLDLHGRDLKTLRPLRGVNLSSLSLVDTRIRNLNVLAKSKLKSLRISGGYISDIRIVGRLALEELRLERCYYLQDLSPISNCPNLKNLLIPPHITNIEFLKNLNHLKILATNTKDYEDGQSVEEFWKAYNDEKTKIE